MTADSTRHGSIASVDPAWAWEEYRPNDKTPWNTQRAGHLIRRLGFTPSWRELQQAVDRGQTATLDELLTPPANADRFYADSRSMSQAIRITGERLELPAWWLYAMVHTPRPVLEKLTLFWHGHFATSGAKVTDPRLMLRQNETLRRHALGKFGPLLAEMARDPAMLVWLDSTTNRKSHPNENFAREVMELFSLGLGNYTEQDIKEAARAFTGWELRLGEFRINRYQHDEGEKAILGRSGKFDGEDCLKILLDQPAAGEFLVGKLYRWLVSEAEPPPPKLIEPVAHEFQRRDYDLVWLIRKIVGSNLFFSSHALGQRIKSPVELSVGLIRSLEGTANYYALAADLERLGQSLFFPPTVKGWDGGAEWISASSLVGRANWVWALVGGGEARYANKVPLERLAALNDVDRPAEVVERLLQLLIGAPVPDTVRVQLTSLAADTTGGERQRRARLVHAIATLPEFQLT